MNVYNKANSSNCWAGILWRLWVMEHRGCYWPTRWPVPQPSGPVIKDVVKKKWFWLLALHPRCDFHGTALQGDVPDEVDGWAVVVELENLQERVKLSIKCLPLQSKRWSHSVHLDRLRPLTPCQSSHILYERLWWQQSGLPLDVYILQTQGRMKRERGKEGSRERENYLQLWDFNPESSMTEGFWARTQRIMANIRVFRVLFMRGVCVYCMWMSEGQIKETYITCLRPAVLTLLLFQSTQAKHLQTPNIPVNS